MMRFMKRISSIIITTAVIMYALTLGAFAVESQKLIVSNVKASQSETVGVNVLLKGNPGIWGLDAVVSYDGQYLELVSVINGEVFEDSGYVEGNLSAYTYKLSFECNDLTNVEGSGFLLR